MSKLNIDSSKWEDWSDRLAAHPNKTIEKFLVSKTVSVQVSFLSHKVYGKIVHLWVRRNDEQPIGWTQLQRVKNEILGNEVTAIQVFPKKSKLIDQVNMYHLWGFLDYDFEVNENGFSF